MIITELTYYESDFVYESTKVTGAYDVRTFDIDHLFSLFVYYFEDCIHLGLRRYKSEETSIEDWNYLKDVGLLFPDISLADPMDIWMNPDEHQINVQLPNIVNERRY